MTTVHVEGDAWVCDCDACNAVCQTALHAATRAVSVALEPLMQRSSFPIVMAAAMLCAAAGRADRRGPDEVIEHVSGLIRRMYKDLEGIEVS